MDQATIVATLIKSASPSGDELSALPDVVEWLNVRADLAGDIAPQWLREHFRGKLIYTLRSRTEAGEFDGALQQRHERLAQAAKYYDLVELEGESDLTADLLERIPVSKRLVSWHGPASDVTALKARFEKLSTVEARLYKLVIRAAKAGDELAPLLLLKLLGRADLVAYAEGQIGFWSRLVATSLGSPMIFGVMGDGPVISGEPNVTRLIKDYGFPALRPLQKLYGIIGNPVFHSLSPRLHNAAYRALGHPALFVPFHVESFSDFWQGVVKSGTLERLGLSIDGLTIASPHKEAALMAAERTGSMTSRGGATNIFIRNNGFWTADTTDPQGVLLGISERRIVLKGKRAAVIGCGGAGRTIAAALDEAGAEVVLVNRGMERGLKAVQLTGLPFVPLSEFKVDGFSIVVNATPVGRDDGMMPCDVAGLSEEALVVDLVYGSSPTPLVSRARALERVAIDGFEVLLIQVLHQFRMMTGLEMPLELALNILPGNRALSPIFAE